MDVFRRYGYEELRTPVFESAELFHRPWATPPISSRRRWDVFKDRGDRELALRPEGTAGVVRAYLEHSWDKMGGIRKLSYIGPMFRAERPQAGRYREFWQLGAEFFGNPSPQADADMLLLVRDILSAFGVGGVTFHINSLGDAVCRPKYREALIAYLSSRRDGLCEDCKRRLDKNPLRCLDCKIDGPKLTDAPVMADHLCEECKEHDKALDGLLKSVDFAYVKDPRLVRGLDYYTRTVFEIKAVGAGEAGVAGVLGAGGRYDGLVKQMGGPDVPAIGFALGMDRVCRARYGEALSQPAAVDQAKRVFVALAGAGTPASRVSSSSADLRRAGFTAEIRRRRKIPQGADALGGFLAGHIRRARGGRGPEAGDREPQELAVGQPRLESVRSESFRPHLVVQVVKP